MSIYSAVVNTRGGSTSTFPISDIAKISIRYRYFLPKIRLYRYRYPLLQRFLNWPTHIFHYRRKVINDVNVYSLTFISISLFFCFFFVFFCLVLGSVLLCVIWCFYNLMCSVFFCSRFQAAIFNKFELS